MAGMLSQLPLPWIPDGAAEVTRGVGLEPLPGGGGAVWVHGLMTFCWDGGDGAGRRRLAAVQLAELKAATQQQVADAFGIGIVTLWRWLDGYRRGGLAGLAAGTRGPNGPSKLTAELTQRIGELAAAGKSQAAIAAATGVSTFAVRAALGRVPARRPAPGAPAAPDGTAGGNAAAPPGRRMSCRCCPARCRGTSGRWPGSGCPGRAPPRCSRPGRGIRWPGCCWRCPPWPGTGLIQAARDVYGRLTDGFYGLETMLVLLVFLALLREPRAEGATRVPPAALGRVLGLDRAPEVKTIRRKPGELAAAGKAAGLQLAIARHHAEARPDDLGFLYVDGHTRAYFGTRDVQKMHIARMKHPGPATEETWVTDGRGDPLLVVLAEPSSSLAAQIKTLLPQLRAICGDGARPVLCFDRGGWSPERAVRLTPRSRSLTDRALRLAASVSSSWVRSALVRSCRSNEPNPSAGCYAMAQHSPTRYLSQPHCDSARQEGSNQRLRRPRTSASGTFGRARLRLGGGVLDVRARRFALLRSTSYLHPG